MYGKRSCLSSLAGHQTALCRKSCGGRIIPGLLACSSNRNSSQNPLTPIRCSPASLKRPSNKADWFREGAALLGSPRIIQAERAKRSEEHTSELQSLMRISYAVFCLKKKKTQQSFVYGTRPIQELTLLYYLTVHTTAHTNGKQERE